MSWASSSPSSLKSGEAHSLRLALSVSCMQTKSIDEALASFLERRSLDEATFRRVRSGVYFYGRTKLLIKFDNQGRLVCLPQHQGLGLLVKQQRYQLLEKFLLHQRRAEAAAASQPQDSDG